MLGKTSVPVLRQTERLSNSSRPLPVVYITEGREERLDKIKGSFIETVNSAKPSRFIYRPSLQLL